MAKLRKREWTTVGGDQRSAYIVDYVDGRGGRQRRQFNRYKEADRFRIKFEGQLSAGIHRPDADKVTAEDACASFLEHCAGRMERNERMTRKMLAVYRGHVTNYTLHPEKGIVGYKLAQLSARPVNQFRDRVRSAGVTVATTRKVLATFAGHSSVQDTRDRYGHLFPSDDHKAAMDLIARDLLREH